MSMVDPREQGGGRERLEFQERTKIPGFKRCTGARERPFRPPPPLKCDNFYTNMPIDPLDRYSHYFSCIMEFNIHAFCQCLGVCPALWLYNFVPASALRVVIRPTQKLI